jgi:AcrR family transcriptional regulator
MTDKQTQILQSALILFADKGYISTSTSAIAKHAGVSEGLIFRHYDSKESLLREILIRGYENIQPRLYSILMENNPKLVIERTIGLPLELLEHKSKDWRLIFSIKFQNLGLYRSINDDKKLLDPLFEKVEQALQKLGFKEAKKEARMLFFLVEGLSSHSIKNGPQESQELLSFIKQKYLEKGI